MKRKPKELEEGDPFSWIPAEVFHIILFHLWRRTGSKSIKNLRLVSKDWNELTLSWMTQNMKAIVTTKSILSREKSFFSENGFTALRLKIESKPISFSFLDNLDKVEDLTLDLGLVPVIALSHIENAFPSLKSLDIIDANIKDVVPILSLKKLSCRISFPFQVFTSLKTLCLKSSLIYTKMNLLDVSKRLEPLKNLRELELMDHDLETVDQCVACLTQLEKLRMFDLETSNYDFDGCAIYGISFPKLKSIEIEGGPWINFACWIKQLLKSSPNLNALKISLHSHAAYEIDFGSDFPLKLQALTTIEISVYSFLEYEIDMLFSSIETYPMIEEVNIKEVATTMYYDDVTEAIQSARELWYKFTKIPTLKRASWKSDIIDLEFKRHPIGIWKLLSSSLVPIGDE